MRSLRLVAITLALALALAACGSGTDDTPSGNDGATEGDAAETPTDDGDEATDGDGGEAIKVGVVLSLTGDASSLGVPEGDTLELYREELGIAGDHPVEWILLDDGSDQTTAVSLVKRLIEDDGVAALVCCTTSPITLAAIDTAQSAGVPMISLGAAATIAHPVEEREFIFKTAVPDSIISAIIAAHMSDNGWNQAAFLGFDDGYGESGREQFEIAAPESGVDVIAEQSFPRDANDVTAEISQLQSAGPDAYLIWATPPGAVIAQQNLRDLGIEEPVYQSHGAANSTFIELGGAAVEGTYLGVPKLLVPNELSDDDPQKSVIVDYKQRYEDEAGAGTINVFGSESLDAYRIIHEALQRAVDQVEVSNLDEFRSTVRDEIEATTDLVGITGIYTYSASDHEGLDAACCTMVQIVDGEWVGVE